MSNPKSLAFPLDQGGLPKNGLLAGGGGGWAQTFIDYVLHADGKIEKREYTSEDGRVDNSTVSTGQGDPNIISEFDAKLTANGFWNVKMDVPKATLVEYLVAVNEKKGAHAAIWPKESSGLPDPLNYIFKDIREYAAKIIDG